MVREATLSEKHRFSLELLSTKRGVEKLFREGEILNKKIDEYELLHITEIEAIASRVLKVSKMLREEHDSQVAEREAKADAIKQLLERAAEQGITMDDLASCGIVEAIIKKPRPTQEKASFLYKNSAGDVVHVIRNASGSGRLSNDLKAFLEKEDKVVTDLIYSDEQVKKALDLNMMPEEFENGVDEEENELPNADLESRIEIVDDEDYEDDEDEVNGNV